MDFSNKRHHVFIGEDGVGESLQELKKLISITATVQAVITVHAITVLTTDHEENVIYDLQFLDIKPDFDLDFRQSGVSVKGNTYFVAQHNTAKFVDVLLCFDFTTERFCQPLPFHYTAEFDVALCVREDNLAVLYKHEDTMEIWIATNIEHDAVSWSKFLKVEMIPLNGFPDDFAYNPSVFENFFIDEENKIAVVCNIFEDKPTKSHQICYSQTAHIIGQDRYLTSVSLGEARKYLEEPLVLSSYVPSLVQLGINQRSKRKHKD